MLFPNGNSNFMSPRFHQSLSIQPNYHSITYISNTQDLLFLFCIILRYQRIRVWLLALAASITSLTASVLFSYWLRIQQHVRTKEHTQSVCHTEISLFSLGSNKFMCGGTQLNSASLVPVTQLNPNSTWPPSNRVLYYVYYCNVISKLLDSVQNLNMGIRKRIQMAHNKEQGFKKRPLRNIKIVT